MKTIKLEDLFFKTIICGFYLALFTKSIYVHRRYRLMNTLIIDKLRRLKGEPVKPISTEGITILDDDTAEIALNFELAKLDAFQRKNKRDE